MKKPQHGGKRKGSGRPKQERTITIRVPVSLVPKIKALIMNTTMNKSAKSG